MSGISLYDFLTSSEDEDSAEALNEEEDVEYLGVGRSVTVCELIEACYDETLSEHDSQVINWVKDGIELCNKKFITAYNRAVVDVGDKRLYRNIDATIGLSVINENWLNTPVIREGYLEMLDVNKAMTRLLGICNVEILGITKYIQLVMSE